MWELFFLSIMLAEGSFPFAFPGDLPIPARGKLHEHPTGNTGWFGAFLEFGMMLRLGLGALCLRAHPRAEG